MRPLRICFWKQKSSVTRWLLLSKQIEKQLQDAKADFCSATVKNRAALVRQEIKQEREIGYLCAMVVGLHKT